jgi:RNA polymerase sigma-B factor
MKVHASSKSSARVELVVNHLGVAITIARRIKGRPDDDVEQVAYMGLVKAADRFDPSLGVSFTTFAWRTIEGEIKRYFRDSGWTLHVSRSLQERTVHVAASVELLTHDLGHSPSTAEIAEHVGCSVEDVVESLEVHRNMRPQSLDSSSVDDDAPVEVGITDEGFDTADARGDLQVLMRRLPDRQREVVFLRFFENLTQTEIAQRLGISQMHVSRLLAQALSSMRDFGNRRVEPSA